MSEKKVVVVDDEMDMRIFISTLLETSGYLPVVARNGKEGLRKVRDIEPDLIILDVMMPGEGGVQMYRQLKTDKTLRDIPVIMLSAVEKKTFFHYLKMLNISLENAIPYPDSYIEKPPDAEELLKIIETHFHQKERHKTSARR
ncbi:MAG: response regulator [Deltaproteobacteria bacterium]|nr:MAG: response regulator [Deltaproteobacteria bacterium]